MKNLSKHTILFLCFVATVLISKVTSNSTIGMAPNSSSVVLQNSSNIQPSSLSVQSTSVSVVPSSTAPSSMVPSSIAGSSTAPLPMEQSTMVASSMGPLSSSTYLFSASSGRVGNSARPTTSIQNQAQPLNATTARKEAPSTLPALSTTVSSVVPSPMASSSMLSSMAPTSMAPSSMVTSSIAASSTAPLPTEQSTMAASSMGPLSSSTYLFSASSGQVGNSARPTTSIQKQPQPTAKTARKEAASTVVNTGVTDTSKAAISPSLSQSQMMSSYQSAMQATASSNGVAQASTTVAHSNASRAKVEATVSSSPIPKASITVGHPTASSNAVPQSSQSVGQTTNSPATSSQAPVETTSNPSKTPTSKGFSCYTCSYNSSGYCRENKETCNNGVTSCLDFHITYKNKTDFIGKACGDPEFCNDPECKNRNKTVSGQIEACKMECCDGSNCNDNFSNKASQLAWQFAFCLAIITTACLFV